MVIAVWYLFIEYGFYKLREIYDVSQLRVWWREGRGKILKDMMPVFMTQDISLDLPADRKKKEEGKKDQ